MTQAIDLPERTSRNWIQTASGKQFWPLNPRVEDIDIEDIAHALAMKCRYTGHCLEFYSVAQHCVLASWAVEPQDALWALMHDATEAYLPDVARPVKRELPGFRDIEDRLMYAIAQRFGLSWPMPDCIGDVDLQLLATERRDLMAPPPIPWVSIENVSPLPDKVEPWLPVTAKFAFLYRFQQLTS